MLKLLFAALAAVLCFAGQTGADLCSLGSVEIDGNWYCQPVQAIQYSNVGSAGTYNQITAMNADGNCSSVPKAFSGPLSPLDEEVSQPPITARRDSYASVNANHASIGLSPFPWSSPVEAICRICPIHLWQGQPQRISSCPSPSAAPQSSRSQGTSC